MMARHSIWRMDGYVHTCLAKAVEFWRKSGYVLKFGCKTWSLK